MNFVGLTLADHHELQQKLEKKERECDAKSQEKDEMMQTLNKMKEKLEKETGEHRLVKQQVAELSARLHDLSTVLHAPSIQQFNSNLMYLSYSHYPHFSYSFYFLECLELM